MAALTISHAKSLTVADFTGTVTVGNSAGGTTTVLATNLARPSDWNSAHAATFSLSASDVSAFLAVGNGLNLSTNTSGSTIAVSPAAFAEPFPFANSNSVTMTLSPDAWLFDPVAYEKGLDSGRFNLFHARDASHFSNTLSANSTSLGGYSVTAALRNYLALYSQGSGSDVTRLNSVWTGKAEISATQSQSFAGATSGMTASNYLTIGMITAVDNSGGSSTSTQTASGTFSTGTTSMNATAVNSLITGAINWFSGSCMDMVPFASTLAPGRYWLAYMNDTTIGGGGTTGVNRTSTGTWFGTAQTRAGIIDVNVSAFKRLGSATSANSSSMGVPFHGSLLTTSVGATASLGTANLQHTTRRIYWNFIQG